MTVNEPMKQLNYPGNVPDCVGSVVGPTTYGELLVIFAADYDADRDVTVAHLRPATSSDINNADGS